MNTDPISLARKVLDRYESRKHSAGAQGYEAGIFTDEVLAHAVLDLTAKVKRVKALADQHDAWAREEMAEGDVSESINTQATADSIRTALNGDTDD